ncbi:hypothetical protein Nwi_1539 [Nitrobacter winogradskyi Nb-255]|uniref:Uncharacterized protein n=1 Tax=Nitrobacter winogradskyi (strain ATCC 25391 / DSM 10237 / CIP 104748 / NCIMB 11846 / Nb-255) TaxID=323098 RepID=Q3SSE1_NITWN|nr:hypothetical protein [Nitrobacter winogradskyi]ABA04800.1 hypothetical protein Nwi_1539 [Nitrobacter winogradskyi Nb-255]
MSIKIIAYLVAAALIASASLYLANLYQKAGAFDVLSAEHHTLEVRYGCDKRPAISERKLPACLIARGLDAEKAHREEIERQRNEAARAQAKLDADKLAAERAQQSENAIIKAAPASDDGPVPKVLLDAWTRERGRLGISK